MSALTGIAVLLSPVMLIVATATAQQVTGQLGSPSGTTTIDGKQLRPPRVVPPKGAPNVLLIMTDDQGYSVSGTRSALDFSYDLPFRFNGTIDKLTYKLGPEQLAADDQKKVQDAVANANN
jgi:hypothetical protein